MGDKQSKPMKEPPVQEASTPMNLQPTEEPPTEEPPTEVPITEIPSTLVPVVTRLSEHLNEREYYVLKEKAHRKEIEQLEKARKDLENEVLNIKIPVMKELGHKLFKKLRQDVMDLEDNIVKHTDECYAISNLRQAVADIKVKIEHLVEDNKIYLSWLTVTLSMTGASVGVAFVPIVGLIISPVLVSVPYAGRLIHRLVVSHKRKKQFKIQQEEKEN